MHNVVLAVRLICLSSNVTWLKSFTRYGHYAGEVEDIIIYSQTRNCF